MADGEGDTARMINAELGDGGGRVDLRSDKHQERVTTSGAEARRLEMLLGNERSEVGRSVLDGRRWSTTLGWGGGVLSTSSRALCGLLGFKSCFSAAFAGSACGACGVSNT